MPRKLSSACQLHDRVNLVALPILGGLALLGLFDLYPATKVSAYACVHALLAFLAGFALAILLFSSSGIAASAWLPFVRRHSSREILCPVLWQYICSLTAFWVRSR